MNYLKIEIKLFSWMQRIFVYLSLDINGFKEMLQNVFLYKRVY